MTLFIALAGAAIAAKLFALRERKLLHAELVKALGRPLDAEERQAIGV